MKAISGNKEPLGSITYKIISATPSEYKNKFQLNKHESNDTYYLNCIEKLVLNNDGKDQLIKLVIKAIESDVAPFQFTFQRQLTSEKTINLRIVSGDMCRPIFDKEIYDFEVIEGQTPILEPIFVKDCDHSVNGQIFLTTTNKNYQLVLNKVYREASLGIEVKKPLDYDNKKLEDIEFYVIARGSNASINKFETKAKIRLTIKNVNEYVPQFIQPSTLDGKVFSYKVPENKDYHLKVKAIDSDEGKDGELVYTTEMINQDDDFGLQTEYDSNEKSFNIIVPGAYLDSKTKVPITFIVKVHDSGEPKLSNEIVINIKAQSSYLHPPYFEFKDYGFDLKESQLNSNPNLKIKLINDNLNQSKLVFKVLNNPLGLIGYELEEMNHLNSKPEQQNSNFDENENDDQLESEKILRLFVNNATSIDLDKVFIENSNSDIYSYTLQVELENNEKMSSDVNIYFRLIDENDNEPFVLNIPTSDNEIIDATIESASSSSFILNNKIKFDREIRFDDLDFSPEFGVESLYLRVNDSRFSIDHEAILNELDSYRTNKNITKSGILLIIKCLTSIDQLVENEPIIWLNVTCEDNYLFSRYNKEKINSKSILIQLNVTKSAMLLNDSELKSDLYPIFEKSIYEFSINENWTGLLTKLNVINKMNELFI